VPATELGLLAQVGAALATGNAARNVAPNALRGLLDGMPPAFRDRVAIAGEDDAAECATVLFEGEGEALARLCEEVAALPGPVRPIFAVTPEGLASGAKDYPLEFLLAECAVSVNTAAAGGNASLMSVG
jgi:RHH-type proline utilization regulon transcriptional repressor/proline dehydrogenase/delta 1-pyrroline-5-carboxylate dehydrogenase